MAANGKAAWPSVALVLLLLVGAVLWLLREHDDGASSRSAPPSLADASQAAKDLPGAADASPLDGGQPATPESLLADSGSPGLHSALRVRVTWQSDGQPAAYVGLRVIFWDIPEPARYASDVWTDRHGEWIAAGVPVGRVTVYLDRGGSTNGVIAAGAETRLELNVAPGLLVKGIVTDESERPVPGAEIWFALSGNHDDGRVIGAADANGRFELRDVRPLDSKSGSHRVAARAPGHGPSGRVAVTGPAGGTVEIVLVLAGECGRVLGLVADEAGKAIPGALVRLGTRLGFPRTEGNTARHELNPPGMLLTSGPDGRFVAEGVPTGHQPLVAVCAGHSPSEDDLLVYAGDNPITLVLLPAADVSGMVRGADGQPLAGADVWIEPRFDPMGSSAKTGADGRYELHDVALGSHLVTASEADAGRATQRLEIASGEHLRCDFTLGTGLAIHGTLLDAAGAPAAGWLMCAVAETGSSDDVALDRTRPDGQFTLTNLGEREHRLLVMGKSLGNSQVLLAEHVRPGTTDLVLHLPEHVGESGGLVARFVDEAGAPLAGVKVTPRPKQQSQPWPVAVSDAAGRLAIAELMVGDWMLTAQAPALPEVVLGPFTVPPGAPIDVGDLVLKRGGTLLVHLVAEGPLGEGWIRGSFQPTGSERAWGLEREGDTLRSPALPAGPGQLLLDARSFAPLSQAVTVVAGAETSVDVRLSPGITQRIRIWAPASIWQATTAVRWHLVVRDSAGTAVLSVDRDLPPIDGRTVDAEQPMMDLGRSFAAGTYVVDVQVGELSRTGLAFSTDAAVPWDIDLR